MVLLSRRKQRLGSAFHAWVSACAARRLAQAHAALRAKDEDVVRAKSEMDEKLHATLAELGEEHQLVCNDYEKRLETAAHIYEDRFEGELLARLETAEGLRRREEEFENRLEILRAELIAAEQRSSYFEQQADALRDVSRQRDQLQQQLADAAQRSVNLQLECEIFRQQTESLAVQLTEAGEVVAEVEQEVAQKLSETRAQLQAEDEKNAVLQRALHGLSQEKAAIEAELLSAQSKVLYKGLLSLLPAVAANVTAAAGLGWAMPGLELMSFAGRRAHTRTSAAA
jgi:hypothetical protein